MKILIDTNIILDYFLEREPFLQDAEILFQAIDSGQLIG
ncbi:MAG: PIN domain-containing protein, partial [Sphaerospermopsis kisseleviana]